LNNPSEHTNSIINLLSPTNNPDSFPARGGHNAPSNVHHSSQTELTPTQSLDALVEHGNRSGISLLQLQSSRGGGEGSNSSLPFTPNENHPHNNNHPSPTERIDKVVESIETGGNDHSPKYISL
jgi:hypothetical protein